MEVKATVDNTSGDNVRLVVEKSGEVCFNPTGYVGWVLSGEKQWTHTTATYLSAS